MKVLTQVFGSVVGRSVIAAWKQVSSAFFPSLSFVPSFSVLSFLTLVFCFGVDAYLAEVGNKEVFKREVNKAWERQLRARAERERLRRNLEKEEPPSDFWGKEGDAGIGQGHGEQVREWFRQRRKDMPADFTPADPKKRSMPPSEAIKVLHLSAATKEDIEKRFELLMAANGDKGASQYLYDKISHAREVALEQLNKGTLKRHFKVKKDDAPPAASDAAGEAPH